MYAQKSESGSQTKENRNNYSSNHSSATKKDKEEEEELKNLLNDARELEKKNGKKSI